MAFRAKNQIRKYLILYHHYHRDVVSVLLDATKKTKQNCLSIHFCHFLYTLGSQDVLVEAARLMF